MRYRFLSIYVGSLRQLISSSLLRTQFRALHRLLIFMPATEHFLSPSPDARVRQTFSHSHLVGISVPRYSKLLPWSRSAFSRKRVVAIQNDPPILVPPPFPQHNYSHTTWTRLVLSHTRAKIEPFQFRQQPIQVD